MKWWLCKLEIEIERDEGIVTLVFDVYANTQNEAESIAFNYFEAYADKAVENLTDDTPDVAILLNTVIVRLRA